MKIYIAGKFEARPVLRQMAEDIQQLGYIVTAKWLTREELHLPKHTVALDDLEGVEAADLLILDTTYPGGSGREVEFGFALAKGKIVWMVGPANNVFHEYNTISHFNDWCQVLVTLKERKNIYD